MKLFGSSGIRGIANVHITPELALNVGKAIGKDCSSAVMATDPRVAGIMIEKAFASGLMSTGCDVTRLGMVPTPTLAYIATNHDLGVMITASHNPAEYVGMKLWNPDGMAFDSKQQAGIEEAVGSSRYLLTKWDGIGNISNYRNAVEDHIKAIMGHTKQLQDLKVIVDCGNGAASVITPFLLQRLGCRVLALNSNPDGHFPARNPEPKEENLELLMQMVKEKGADLGLAHDGDADRMMAVDDKGRFVNGDQLLAIFASHEEAESIIVPVDTSMIVDDALPGIRIIRSRVGDVYVAETMKKEGAAFGGEPSGSWIFPRISFCPDGIYAAVRLIEIIGIRKLSEIVDELPVYQTRRDSVTCPDQHKDIVMAGITDELSCVGEVSTIDGIRVDTDNGWVLVRPSGTEPKIRVTAEARFAVDDLFFKTCRTVESAVCAHRD